MSRAQIILIGTVLALFCVLYFGCDTKPKEQKLLEKSRTMEMEVTSPEILIAEAKTSLSDSDRSIIQSLEIDLRNSNDSTKVDILKKLSSRWYSVGDEVIAGCYAQEVAKIEDNEESWSIAGTTFVIGLKNAKTDKRRQFSFGRSVSALEKAISLNPSNVDHKLNLALSYTEFPPQDNPMKGVLMLKNLNTKYPKSTSVLNQLGRLAIKTNQIDKAIERLGQSEAIDATNATTICLLAQAYERKGDQQNINIYTEKCNSLINKS